MVYSKQLHTHGRHGIPDNDDSYRYAEDIEDLRPVASETTGEEAEYLKSLVDSRVRVTVVLDTGERLTGRIRYYDQHCFSLGQAGGGPKLLLRKEQVQSIREE